VSIFFRPMPMLSSLPFAERSPCVLCLGDSLTAGYVGGATYQPYAISLSHHLGVPVDEIGLSGARADELVANMPRSVCVDHFGKMTRGLLVQLALREYTLCVIMVGTNDINTGRSADSVFADVKQLHTVCHERGIRTVALPIPESRFIQQPHAISQALERQTFNTYLRLWAMQQGGRSLFVDMATQVPFSDFTEDWAIDGLHMSRQGYDIFGTRLSYFLRSFLVASPPPSPTAIIHHQPHDSKIFLEPVVSPRARLETPRVKIIQAQEPTVSGVVWYERSNGAVVRAHVVGPSTKGSAYLTVDYEVGGILMRNQAAPTSAMKPVPTQRGG